MNIAKRFRQHEADDQLELFEEEPMKCKYCGKTLGMVHNCPHEPTHWFWFIIAVIAVLAVGIAYLLN